jgi:hypothetical protein
MDFLPEKRKGANLNNKGRCWDNRDKFN